MPLGIHPLVDARLVGRARPWVQRTSGARTRARISLVWSWRRTRIVCSSDHPTVDSQSEPEPKTSLAKTISVARRTQSPVAWQERLSVTNRHH